MDWKKWLGAMHAWSLRRSLVDLSSPPDIFDGDNSIVGHNTSPFTIIAAAIVVISAIVVIKVGITDIQNMHKETAVVTVDCDADKVLTV